MTSAQFIDRLKQLQEWLVSLGACRVCALDMAYAQADREEGYTKTRAVASRACRKNDGARCFAIGRRHWGELPKPEGT
jgi:hypothetical protein